MRLALLWLVGAERAISRSAQKHIGYKSNSSRLFSFFNWLKYAVAGLQCICAVRHICAV
jgi:hypothetical protein